MKDYEFKGFVTKVVKVVKKAFDENGIEIPFPHLSVYMGEASRAFDVFLNEAAGRPKELATAENV